jgi:pimeloyl-ACP methyl ester carboxylesterase
MTQHADLANDFTVVAWDQRGSGGSYKGAAKDTLTVERLTDDAHELVLWLCREFGKDQVFLLGGSWGSELGTWLAFRYPEHIGAFVGFGQVVDGAKNEEISYAFALEAARAAGDAKSVRQLEDLGPPARGMYKGGYKGMMIQRRVMMKYGGYSLNQNKRSYFRAMVLPILFSGEYSPADLLGIIKGHKYVLEAMWPEVGATNFPQTCTRFQVPYFIFDGVHDQNTPASLVEDYFNLIEAPRKELIWFTESGHNPMADEPAKFKALLRDRLLSLCGN